MNTSVNMVYIFGQPGSGKTFLSDQMEKEFLANAGADSIPVSDSNLDVVVSNLEQYRDTILVVQSNTLTKDHIKILKRFVENDGFNRAVIIQSEFEPDLEERNFCKVYEVGYPHFEWVTQIADNLWEAKAINIDKIARAPYKIQACELVRNYRTGTDGVIYGEGI